MLVALGPRLGNPALGNKFHVTGRDRHTMKPKMLHQVPPIFKWKNFFGGEFIGMQRISTSFCTAGGTTNKPKCSGLFRHWAAWKILQGERPRLFSGRTQTPVGRGCYDTPSLALTSVCAELHRNPNPPQGEEKPRRAITWRKVSRVNMENRENSSSKQSSPR